ncbi:MAG: TetR/AcrR family transcriptional regulator [Anaerolineae bacterium]|nr:TetR/AcrR family transcriptional regulator [Anaerolineae bacterium]
MMQKGTQTKTRLLEKTAELLAVQGYHATGLNQITQESGTPIGSLYYYFRGGKDELVTAAMHVGGDAVAGALSAAFAAPDMPTAIRSVVQILAQQLHESDYQKGCPVATVTLEAAAQNDSIQLTAQAVYRGWQQQIAAYLIQAGYEATQAESIAAFSLVVIEGGLLLSRAERHTAPLEQAGEHLIQYITCLRSKG